MASLGRCGRAVGLALRLLPCVGLAACNLITELTQPPWPSREAMAAFDFRPIECDPAFMIFDRAFFAYGAWADCRFDFATDGGLAGFTGQDVERHAGAAGNVVLRLILTEVEKLHPSNPENREAASRLLARRAEADGKRGHDALEASGCDAMRPQVRDALLKILRFSP